MDNPNPPEFKNPGISTDQKVFFELVEIRRILSRLASSPNAKREGGVVYTTGPEAETLKGFDAAIEAAERTRSPRRLGRKKP